VFAGYLEYPGMQEQTLGVVVEPPVQEKFYFVPLQFERHPDSGYETTPSSHISIPVTLPSPHDNETTHSPETRV
jgi:hypothetical protein